MNASSESKIPSDDQLMEVYPAVTPLPEEEIPSQAREAGISSRLMAIAVHFGMVYLGKPLRWYMKSAAENMRYATVHVWGEQGSMKSNHTLQQGSWMYGELIRGEWFPDWDTVLESLVFRPGKEERGFLRLVKSIPLGQRVPWIGWDDLGVHFPSTTWRTDMPKYQAIDATWAAIRTKISVITTNNPLIDRVAKNIKDNISFEVFLGPNQMLLVERFCRLPGLRGVESFFFKIPIEGPYQFDYKLVPGDVWKDYWELRLKLADEAIQKLDETYRNEPEDMKEYVPVYELFDQDICTPSRLISYAARDLITVVKVGGKRYVHKDDVEHVLKKCGRAKPQKVSVA